MLRQIQSCEINTQANYHGSWTGGTSDLIYVSFDPPPAVPKHQSDYKYLELLSAIPGYHAQVAPVEGVPSPFDLPECRKLESGFKLSRC